MAISITITAAVVICRDVGFFGGNVDDGGKTGDDACLPVLANETKSDRDILANDAEMNNNKSENAKMYVSAADGTLSANKTVKYVDVLMPDGKTAKMELEEYVKGCVFGEMPLSFEPQALMAQCIAVRSFTVRQRLCGTSKHKNADVCTDSACCQSYVSPSVENPNNQSMKKLSDAVCATKGIIMLYDDEPIEAVYHASSGECTLNSEDVWGGKVEYLRSVPSPEGESELPCTAYGHRVGMSQQGANLLAGEGMGYAEILKYYYKDISFGFLP